MNKTNGFGENVLSLYSCCWLTAIFCVVRTTRTIVRLNRDSEYFQCCVSVIFSVTRIANFHSSGLFSTGPPHGDAGKLLVRFAKYYWSLRISLYSERYSVARVTSTTSNTCRICKKSVYKTVIFRFFFLSFSQIGGTINSTIHSRLVKTRRKKKNELFISLLNSNL